MRVPLTIDDDVLDAAKALAAERRQSLGKTISELARDSLRRLWPQSERNGVPLLSVGPNPARVTLQIVNAMRDAEP